MNFHFDEFLYFDVEENFEDMIITSDCENDDDFSDEEIEI